MKYYLTSALWTGQIELHFNDEQLLTCVDTREANLNAHQHRSFLEYLPLSVEQLNSLIARAKHLKSVKIEDEITFEMFWKKYPHPEGDTHKSRCEKTWGRLSKSDRAGAYGYITRYVNSLPLWRGVMLANTYLNNKGWKN